MQIRIQKNRTFYSTYVDPDPENGTFDVDPDPAETIRIPPDLDHQKAGKGQVCLVTCQYRETFRFLMWHRYWCTVRITFNTGTSAVNPDPAESGTFCADRSSLRKNHSISATQYSSSVTRAICRRLASLSLLNRSLRIPDVNLDWTIWDRLRQKTISRYCPFKFIIRHIQH